MGTSDQLRTFTFFFRVLTTDYLYLQLCLYCTIED